MRVPRNRIFIVLTGLLILLGITVSGCSKEPVAREGKKIVPAEKEKKEERKEEGVVTLSPEKQK